MIDPEDEHMTTLEETLYLAKECWPADVRWIGSLTDEQKHRLTARYSIRMLGRHMDGSVLYSMKYKQTDLPDQLSVSE
jgi:hypothetical protein